MIYPYDEPLDRPVWVLTTPDGDWALPPLGSRGGGFVVFTSPARAAHYVWWSRQSAAGRAVGAVPAGARLVRARLPLLLLAAEVGRRTFASTLDRRMAAYLIDPRPAITGNTHPELAVDAERLDFADVLRVADPESRASSADA